MLRDGGVTIKKEVCTGLFLCYRETAMPDNTLYYGDNLDVLREHVPDESVDLIYLDPPFKSNQNYNVLFAERDGSQAAAQIKAFKDTWRWDRVAAAAYREIVEAGGQVSQALQSFRGLLGDNDMLAYLSMMAPRLVELHRVLKPTGSIYLHCDPTASHYLKLLLDAVFGPANFRNEVIWGYRTGGATKKNFARKHDVILFYAKSSRYAHNPLMEKAYTKSKSRKAGIVNYGAGKAEFFEDEEGVYNWVIMRDVWDIPYLNSQAGERLGYPTQKPEALLERIIRASSQEGDIVLDPFCGCGTTIAAAQRLGRRWIGIDITHLAINLIRHRLHDAFGAAVAQTYQVIGEPKALPDAAALAQQDPYQFQWWALGLVGARPVEQKKGADRGIDGRLYFHDEGSKGRTKQIILSVKAGKTGVAHVRDLRGVVQREQAAIGVLISLQEPTRAMRQEVASADPYHSPGWQQDYPSLQLLTIADLFAGQGIAYPHMSNVTYQRAPRAGVAADTKQLL